MAIDRQRKLPLNTSDFDDYQTAHCERCGGREGEGLEGLPCVCGLIVGHAPGCAATLHCVRAGLDALERVAADVTICDCGERGAKLARGEVEFRARMLGLRKRPAPRARIDEQESEEETWACIGCGRRSPVSALVTAPGSYPWERWHTFCRPKD